ncbi:MAG: NADH-quinone oxidoreductase subunit NuoN [Hyphomicrobium sp.]|nr:MAG: NADH-quinone oxidoreductase subunit NuoN [Hyphomicrobium sp.]
MTTFLAALGPVYPEIIVALGAMALLMYGVFRPETEANAEITGWLAILILAVAAATVALGPVSAESLFEGAFVSNAFTNFSKLLVLAGSAFALMLSFDYFRRLQSLKFEYPVLVLLASVGMMIMVSANDMISLYLGLELQSLALYVLAAIRRDNVRSSEAGLKYFVLGALSSGMLLYGASLIYGYTGSTNFSVIASVAKGKAAAEHIGLIIGLVFLLVGLAFKISAVPFHMWTPDVYEGAPTPVTALFAAAPKIAAMTLLVRTLHDAFPGLGPQWQQVITVLAIASMVLGAVSAIGQTNIKRLMAYSSIGHVGYALVGLAPNSSEGMQAVLVYLSIYLVMTIGVFACMVSMHRKEGPVEEIADLAGLSKTNLPLAFALFVLLFSLAGIPPLGGFFAKFYVFAAAIKGGLYPLAIIGVVASVIAAYYYLSIVKVMFFDDAKEKMMDVPRVPGMVVAGATVFVVFFAMFAGPVIAAAAAAAKVLKF